MLKSNTFVHPSNKQNIVCVQVLHITMANMKTPKSMTVTTQSHNPHCLGRCPVSMTTLQWNRTTGPCLPLKLFLVFVHGKRGCLQGSYPVPFTRDDPRLGPSRFSSRFCSWAYLVLIRLCRRQQVVTMRRTVSGSWSIVVSSTRSLLLYIWASNLCT